MFIKTADIFSQGHEVHSVKCPFKPTYSSPFFRCSVFNFLYTDITVLVYSSRFQQKLVEWTKLVGSYTFILRTFAGHGWSTGWCIFSLDRSEHHAWLDRWVTGSTPTRTALMKRENEREEKRAKEHSKIECISTKPQKS